MNERQELKIKIEKLRKRMEEKQLQGILLRQTRNFSWLTGGKANSIVWSTPLGVADILITPEKAYCITTKMESERIEAEELDGLGFEMVTPEWVDGIEKAIQDICGNHRIGTDVWPASTGLVNSVYMEQEIAELSYVLLETERNRYRQLCLTVARTLESTCREITPGMTEFEIQAMLAQKVLAKGIRPVVILVATDERIYRYRHPIPTSKRLDSYAMVVLCAEQSGLIANVTRLVHFGPISQELQENRLKLAQIDATMNMVTRPGIAIKDVFNSAIQAYQEVGHGDDWRYLHQGGPTGYATREFLATPHSTEAVQLHQAFAWNPSIRGVKSEDTILVCEKQNEFFTHTHEWAYIIIKRNGQELKRPDILIR